MAYLVELEEHPIRVTAHGEWRHGPTPLHPKVEHLFRRNVRLAEPGQYIVQLDHRRAPLEVEDTAFFVQSVRFRENAGDLIGVDVLVSDDQWEQLDPRTLMQSGDNVLYCRVQRDKWLVPCRFRAHQYHELTLRMEEDEQGWYLAVGGERYRLRPYDPTWLPA